MRGMMEVPPPTTILKPFTPSTTFGKKPMSWIGVMAQSLRQPEKAVFIFRGMDWVNGCLTK